MLAALYCLAEMLYFEARSEPPLSQLAVAYSAVNRQADARYPADTCGVVHDPGQYSYHSDGKSEGMPDKRARGAALRVAGIALLGLLPDPTHGATHYHEICHYTWWAEGHMPVAWVGNHFYYVGIP